MALADPRRIPRTCNALRLAPGHAPIVMKDIWVGATSALVLGVLIWGSPVIVQSAPAPPSVEVVPNWSKDTLERVGDPPPSRAPTSPAAVTTSQPALLTLPTRGVQSDVIRVSMDSVGGVTVPEDVSITGWYDGSKPLDARRGATVIVGHRDARTQGPGALFGIEEFAIGDEIQVTGDDDVIRSFTVDEVELIHKDDLPQRAPEIFGRSGTYRLTLITCGGAFDEAARSYLYNVIVTATPTST
jgi:hypothetical protein